MKGSAEIIQDLDGVLKVLQSSNNAVIEWEDFSIDVNELTQFLQPGSDSATLNRVTSGAISQLMGELKANGKILVINPNGIVIGSDAVIDTAGFIASALDVDDEEFMAGKDMTFRGNGDGAVINMGRIQTSTGDVFLIAKTVENKGQITAKNGTVGLAAGQEVLLLAAEDAKGERIFVRPAGVGGKVDNSGIIEAATAELKAKGGIYQTAINNTGQVTATRVENRGGRIFLRAGSGSSGLIGGSGGGKIFNSGSLIAKGNSGAGGKISINAGTGSVQIGGLLDVSGEGLGQGGKIQITGAEIDLLADVELKASGWQGGEIALGQDEGSAEVATQSLTIHDGAILNAAGEIDGGAISLASSNFVQMNGYASVVGGMGMGGSVDVFGDEVIIGSTGVVDASGAFGGGSIRIGGDFQGLNEDVRNATTLIVEEGAAISSNALVDGDGGRVILWSDDTTTFAGSVSAREAFEGTGGLAEISGKKQLNYSGEVDLGMGGNLLLDPTDFIIGTTQRDSIRNTINLGTNVTVTTNPQAGGDFGDITVDSSFAGMNGAGNLTLLANRHIYVNQDLLNDGTGDINLVAGWNGSTAGGGLVNGANVGVDVDMFASFFTSNVGGTATPGTFGNNNGSIFIDTVARNAAVSVGSAQGETNLVAYDLVLSSGTSTTLNQMAAQVGNDRVASTGNITIEVLNNVTMQQSATAAAAGTQHSTQIGHGGRDRNFSQSGDITIYAGANISAMGGSLADGYSLIGHGGSLADGNFSGDISLTAGDAISVTGGTAADTYGQVGHGGRQARGNHGLVDVDGNAVNSIDVLAGGNITFTGGTATRAYAQLGFGGHDADPTSNPRGAAANLNVTSTAGSILFQADQLGSGDSAFVQLGNGGYDNNGSHRGNIDVAAGLDITLAASPLGTGANGYAQIGNGGRNSSGNHSGNISLEAGTGNASGSVTVRGGTTAADRYAQVGHGGRLARGVHSGDIGVTALDSVLFQGGGTTRGYAQMGHGGSDADLATAGVGTAGNSGDLTVMATNGSIEFRWAATNSGIGTDAYTQLGHGGNSTSGDHTGDIVALAGTNILFRSSTGGTGVNGYSQMGHGGINTSGNFSGDITALANSGTLQFRGGTGTGVNRYAQLGHGGANSTGDFSGDIAVLSDGTITFSSLSTTAAALQAYTQLGHGGYNADAVTGHSGDIGVASRIGAINFTGAAVASMESYAQLGHGGYDADGDHEGDIVVRSGNDTNFTAGAGAGFSNYAQLGHGGMMSDGNRLGHITVSAQIGGDFTDIGDFDLDLMNDTVTLTAGTSSNGLRFIAGSDATAASGDNYSQLGHGGRLARGTNEGDIYAESLRQFVFVSGQLGYRNYTQLGHGGHDAAVIDALPGTLVNSGDITAISHTANVDARWTGTATNTSSETYSQIGHGGYVTDPTISGVIAGGDNVGDITVIAGTSILLRSTNSTTAHIVTNEQSVANYSQMGHGGMGWSGNHSGDITAYAGTQGGTGTIQALSGSGADRYVQLGHGGTNTYGTHSGDISVLARQTITFTGGSGTRAYVQLGHGGYNADSPLGHSGRIGVASLTGSLDFDGGAGTSLESYGQLGHGGFDAAGAHHGDIVVRAGNDVLFDAGLGDGTRSYVQLGHGGMKSATSTDPAANLYGNITVSSQLVGPFNDVGDFFDGMGNPGTDDVFDSLDFTIGTGTTGVRFRGSTNVDSVDQYALLGHGGTYNRGDHGLATDVFDVQAQRSVSFLGGAGTRGYAQLGNGGYDSDDSTSALGNQGAIMVTTTGGPSINGNITFTAGAGQESYVQLGHGGFMTEGSHSGDISAMSQNNIGFLATGTTYGGYAQLGHGGIGAAGDHSGDILASTLNSTMTFTGGVGDTVNLVGDRYAQLGHGGTNAIGAHSGDITVSVEGNITFNTGGSSVQGYSQLGHGGLGAESVTGHSGDISVQSRAGLISFAGGSGTAAIDAYSQLGHGGAYSRGNHTGDIEALAFLNLNIVGNTGPRSYAQLGHGGYDADHLLNPIGNSGDITVGSQTANIEVRWSADNTTSGLMSYAQIGHGGSQTNGTHHGDITARAGGNLLIRASTGNSPTGNTGAYAQMGHGGMQSEGDHYGNITVSAGIGGTFTDVFDVNGNGMLGEDPEDGVLFTSNLIGAIDVTAGSSASDRYAQLGHGGRQARGDQGLVDADGLALDTIEVTALGNITFNARGATRGYAQLGNGGHDAENDLTARGAAANIIVSSLEGSINFSGGTGDQAYAQLGNGGYDNDGNHTGNIKAVAYQNIDFFNATTGTTANAYTQLGHGGRASDGNHSGNISVQAVTGYVNFLGGSVTDRYAQLGHGGRQGKGIHSGIIDVLAATDVTFTAGAGTRTYAQLGHGGHDADPAGAVAGSPGNYGDIRVGAQQGNVVFTGGSAGDAYAQLGHGGLGTIGSHGTTPAINESGAGFVGTTQGGASSSLANGEVTASTVVIVIDPLGTAVTFVDDGNGNLIDPADALGLGVDAIVGSINYATGEFAFNTDANSGGLDVAVNYQYGSSDILVRAGGNVDLVASAVGSGSQAYVQLGHGGLSAQGHHRGDISVWSGVDGTFEDQFDLNMSGILGDTNAMGADSVLFTGAADGLGGIHFSAGSATDRFAQLGHGGRAARGDSEGDITVVGRDSVSFTGGALATITAEVNVNLDTAASTPGGGGTYTLATTANVSAGTLILTNNDPLAGFGNEIVDIGGGELQDTFSGITVGSVDYATRTITFNQEISNAGTNVVSAFYNHFNYDRGVAQLGHGGHDADFPNTGVAGTRGNTGDILVASLLSDLTFQAGSGLDSYVQMGHGGLGTTGDHVGDIIARAAGNITFNAGLLRNTSYAQLGNGGWSAIGNHSGNITVSSGTDGLFNGLDFTGSPTGAVTFTAGGTQDSYAQLGNGGRLARGDHGLVDGDGNALETISVSSQGDVTFTSGTATRTYAMLGNGGHDADSTTNPRGAAANLEVESVSGSVIFSAPANADSAFVQIGNGGYDTSGNHRGSINVSAAQDVSFSTVLSGSTANSYNQLGHGGRNAAGDHSGDITVTAGTGGVSGGITFTAGSGANDRFSQLGHGGRLARGNHSGDITLNALDTIAFQAGGTTRGYAQLGHGGHDADLVDSGPGMGGNSGDIYARSLNGSIEFRWAASNSGVGTESYAQMGHGGSQTNGDHNGDITALAGSNLLFRNTTGGTGNHAYVQLGHGGYLASGNFDGDITALADTGTIQFRSGVSTTAGSGQNRYAQLGHGGTNALGDHSGDISVLSNGNITFSNLGTSTAVQMGYTQLGHGGNNADAVVGHSGDISVGSRTGQLAFTGGPGGSLQAYTQLGHGGYDAAGGHTGDIVVRVGSNLLFDAGQGTGMGSYAQLGHGGLKADMTTDPAASHVGDITVSSLYEGTFSDLGDFYDGLGMMGPDGIADDIAISLGTGTTGLRFRGSADATGVSMDQYAQLGHGGAYNRGDHSGDIEVISGRTAAFTGGAATRAYAQLGHGGYDADDTSTAMGNEGDISVWVTGIPAGANLTFTAGGGQESYAQLGHGGFMNSGDHSGEITALSDNNIGFLATGLTYGGYAQMGHGGIGATGNHSGDITALANRSTITFTGGIGDLTNYVGDRYAQLGHGGLDAAGNHSGDISVLAQGTVTFNSGVDSIGGYSQLGHGGNDADSTTGHTGDIKVGSRTGAINFTAATGASVEAYAQLGHGGFDASGDHNGDIVVRAGNDLNFTASAGTDLMIPDPVDPINNPPTRVANNGYAQLGHGGFAATGDHTGSITVSSQIAGDFTDLGDFDGDDLPDTVTLTAGTSTNGLRFLAGSNNTVDAATDAYSQLGHGGHLARGINDGNISVEALRQVVVQAGQIGARTYAQIGHGGHDSALINGGPGTLANSGDISVQSATGVINAIWAASTTNTSSDTYVQIGHGGYVTDPALSGVIAGGDNMGDITLIAGSSILFRSTDSATANLVTGEQTTGNYVQLGHGGFGWTGDHSGDISARAGANGTGTLQFLSGNGSSSTVGAENRYAQLGHGGAFARGTHTGDIEALAQGSIIFRAGALSRAYAQLGHGGFDADPLSNPVGNSGDIMVGSQTGNVEFRWSADSTTPGLQSYAQLGHGGSQTNGTHNGDITVRTGGNVLFRASTGNTPSGLSAAYAQLGHGGYLAEGNHYGNITVSAGVDGIYRDVYDVNGNGVLGEDPEDDVLFTTNGTGTLTFQGGSGAGDRYAQLGHGGRQARGDHGRVDVNGLALDTIDVSALGNILFQARSSTRNYALLGNGGHDAELASTTRGAAANIYVTSMTGNVSFLSGSGSEAFAQLGNGGYNNDGNHVGDLKVSAGQDVTFTGVTSTSGNAGQYSMLGNGGRAAVGNHSGDISVIAGTDGVNGSVNFTGGTGANSRFAQLGHGGRNARGDHSGIIQVLALDSINFNAGLTGSQNYAQLGHGGYDSDQPNNTITLGNTGNIFAGALRGNILFNSGGGTESYAQLGHGGFGTYGNHSGNILARAGGSVGFMGATNATSASGYVQLGHGGMTAQGNNVGNITVIAGADGIYEDQFDLDGDGMFTAADGVLFEAAGAGLSSMTFTAGTATDRYAQLGHGGRQARGDQIGEITVAARDGVSFAAGGIAMIENEVSTALDTAAQTGGTATLATTNNLIPNTILIENSLPLSPEFATIHDDGAGNLLDENNNPVGTINYSTGQVTFTVAVSDVATSVVQVDYDHTNYSRGYAQLGHGGHDADLTTTTVGNTGNIVVSSELGSISFAGGVVNENFAQLGHGGLATQGANTGDIMVDAGGMVTLTGGASGSDTYAQFGHGGAQAEGNQTGKVVVDAGTGIALAGGDGTRAYAQMGHGGGDTTVADADGNQDGVIVARTLTGDVSLTGQNGSASYAQIGHGGFQNDGVLNGDVFVFADTGDVNLTSGTAANAYAMIGHGASSGTTTGNRSGRIWVQAGGTIDANSGLTDARIAHRTTSGTTSTEMALLGGDWSLDDLGLATGIKDMLEAGADVLLAATSGDLDLTTDLIYSTASTLNLAAVNDVNVLSLVQNIANGALNAIGGWDGSTGLAGVDHNICPPVVDQFFNALPVLLDPSTYGVGGGDVWIGDGTQSTDVALGSRNGVTRVAADELFVQGSDSTAGVVANLGYLTSVANPDASGNIVGTLNGDIHVTGGDAANTNAFIGHGGAGTGTRSGLITLSGQNATIQSGSGAGTDAQIGHWGNASATSLIDLGLSGDLTIAGGDTTNATARLGHSGSSVSAGITTSASNVMVNGGTGDGATAQLGHSSSGTATGDVQLTVDNTVSVQGGSANASAQIGHRGTIVTGGVAISSDDATITGGSASGALAQIGHNSSGTASGELQLMLDNALTVQGGGTSGEGQLGHRGTSTTGGVTVSADSASIAGGSGDAATAQLGHRSSGPASGEVMLTLDDTLNVQGGGTNASALVGHRGTSATGGITASADSATITGGTGDGAFAQLGHGGNGTASGALALDVNGALTMNGGDGILGYSQVGHGGANTTGTKAGNIDVQAGTVVFMSGGMGEDAYSQIGHGGANSSGNLGGVDDVIMVTSADGVNLQGGVGTGSYAQIGLGGSDDTAADADGSRNAKIVVQSTNGGVSLASGSGDNAYTQIGHGGTLSDGAMSGGVYVFADNGDLTMNAGTGLDAYSLIGHGAADASSSGTRQGDVWVQASNAVSVNSNGANTATIGHLTNTAGGVNGGQLAIIGDTLFLSNGAGIGIGSMLNGGADALLAATSSLAIDADILYNGSGDLDLVSGSDITIRALVQNGGSGDINLIGGWNGSTGLALVDHNTCPPVTGDFFNNALVLASANNFGGTVQIGGSGIGSPAAVGSANGTTRVAANNLRILGSDGTSNSWAQLGYSTHGGSANTSGDILVTLNGDLFVGGGDANFSEALLGHGGGAGDLGGDIQIFADSARVEGGAGNRSFGQIGLNSTSSADGDIDIEVTEGIYIRGGTGTRAFAKVGHGGVNATGDYYGDIVLSAEDGVGKAQNDPNDISVIRGKGTDAYAQVGHGDFLFSSGKSASATGERGGNIQLRAGSDVISKGGMIGHVDPNVSKGTAKDGNLVVAVSRDQPQSILGAKILGEPIPSNDGVGKIIAKDGASFAVAGGSQLRIYVPTRAGVEVEEGTRFNGIKFMPVAINDARALFETARVQVTSDGITIIRPFVPLFQPADENDPFFDSAFFESFLFYYDSLLANEPKEIIDFLYESGFDNSRDRIEDLESALKLLPKSGKVSISWEPVEGEINPYSTWWLVARPDGATYMLELTQAGEVFAFKLSVES